MLLEQSTTTTLLVKRCLAGDAIAWQQLVDTYARLVHSIPVRHGLSQDEVSDVGQEVFIALAKNLHQLEDPERLPEVPVGGKPAAKAGVGNKPAARAAGNKPAARAAGNKPAARAPVK